MGTGGWQIERAEMGASSVGIRPAECCCFYGWTIFTVATAVRTHTCTVWIGETPTPLTPLTPHSAFHREA